MAKEINIAIGQHLTNVMDMIPSNVILNKVITGCGATTLEINSARNSIIIEPNVPVIEGKAAKHKNVSLYTKKYQRRLLNSICSVLLMGIRKL